MFKYIGYNLNTDTLIASNDKMEGYLMSNAPQQFEYFSSIEEALKWLKNHPNAHEKYIKDLEEEYKFLYGQEIQEQLNDEFDEYIINNYPEDLSF